MFSPRAVFHAVRTVPPGGGTGFLSLREGKTVLNCTQFNGVLRHVSPIMLFSTLCAPSCRVTEGDFLDMDTKPKSKYAAKVAARRGKLDAPAVSSDVNALSVETSELVDFLRRMSKYVKSESTGVPRAVRKLFWSSIGIERSQWSACGGHLRVALRHLKAASLNAQAAVKAAAKSSSPSGTPVKALKGVPPRTTGDPVCRRAEAGD